MRIVGGRLGGRRIKPPPGSVTRPTAERVREAIASALEARDLIDGRRVLDAYAGSGALGFEMLSRGASHVVFVEKDGRVAQALVESARELGVSSEVTILRADVNTERGQAEIVERGPFGLLLADPPYRDVPRAIQSLAALSRSGVLADDAHILLEHASKGGVELPAEFRLINAYRYGDTAVTLFVHGGPDR